MACSSIRVGSSTTGDVESAKLLNSGWSLEAGRYQQSGNSLAWHNPTVRNQCQLQPIKYETP
jgi:hypothetical protein